MSRLQMFSVETFSFLLLRLPIVKQTKLMGALYLENNLTPRAFT